MKRIILNPESEGHPLRVTELMIGDWIQTPKGEMIVRSISQDGTILCGKSANASGWEKLSEYEVRPVHLSWDTLLQNGFVDKHEHPVLCSCELSDDENKLKVIVREHAGNEDWICSVVSMRTPNKEIPIIRLDGINYVHEFQHILRLVGTKTRIPACKD